MGLSRAEDILESKIAGTAYDKPPLSRIEALLIQLDAGGGGGEASIKRIVVDVLPTENIDTNALYLVPSRTPGFEDYYSEYTYLNGTWEKLGETPDGTGISYDKLDNKPSDITNDYIDSLFK